MHGRIVNIEEINGNILGGAIAGSGDGDVDDSTARAWPSSGTAFSPTGSCGSTRT